MCLLTVKHLNSFLSTFLYLVTNSVFAVNSRSVTFKNAKRFLYLLIKIGESNQLNLRNFLSAALSLTANSLILLLILASAKSDTFLQKKTEKELFKKLILERNFNSDNNGNLKCFFFVISVFKFIFKVSTLCCCHNQVFESNNMIHPLLLIKRLKNY